MIFHSLESNIYFENFIIKIIIIIFRLLSMKTLEYYYEGKRFTH